MVRWMLAKRTLALGLLGLALGAGEAGAQGDPQGHAPAAPAVAVTGTVTETMSTGGYTYVRVDTGDRQLWAAAPQFEVAVGDTVSIPPGMAMNNYRSKTLDRTFDEVLFVGHVSVVGTGEGAAPGTPPHGSLGGEPEVAMDFSGLAKPEGGRTVHELYSEKADLVGTEVLVRGKVVKFARQIMGLNWIHVQDGSGSAGTNDLTVTTTGAAKVGDTVLVRGKLAADKEFGFGYRYDLIIERAQVTVE